MSRDGSDDAYESSQEDEYDSKSQDPSSFKYGDEEFEDEENEDEEESEIPYSLQQFKSKKNRKRKRTTDDENADEYSEEELIHRKRTDSIRKRAKSIMASLGDSSGESEDDMPEDIDIFHDIFEGELSTQKETHKPVLIPNPDMVALYTMAPSSIIALFTSYHQCARTGAFQTKTNKPCMDITSLKRNMVKFNVVDTVLMHYFHRMIRTHILELHERQIQGMLHGKNAVKEETPEQHERRNAHIVLTAILFFSLQQLGRITVEDAIKYEEKVFKQNFLRGKFESIIQRAIAIQNY